MFFIIIVVIIIIIVVVVITPSWHLADILIKLGFVFQSVWMLFYGNVILHLRCTMLLFYTHLLLL